VLLFAEPDRRLEQFLAASLPPQVDALTPKKPLLRTIVMRALSRNALAFTAQAVEALRCAVKPENCGAAQPSKANPDIISLLSFRQ